jgi:hypothetical protein
LALTNLTDATIAFLPRQITHAGVFKDAGA